MTSNVFKTCLLTRNEFVRMWVPFIYTCLLTTMIQKEWIQFLFVCLLTTNGWTQKKWIQVSYIFSYLKNKRTSLPRGRLFISCQILHILIPPSRKFIPPIMYLQKLYILEHIAYQVPNSSYPHSLLMFDHIILYLHDKICPFITVNQSITVEIQGISESSTNVER